MSAPLDLRALSVAVARALAEDIGAGDLSGRNFLDVPARGVIVAEADLVVCGLPAAQAAFLQVDPDVRLELPVADGARVGPGTEVLRVTGPGDSLLAAERVALNFVQRLSGVATLTHQYVDAVAGTRAAIYDTRKTTPGLRVLEKYAVVTGGGRNHRMGLYDQVLIKDNHVALAGGIAAAVERADVIMLDNFGPADLKEAVRRVNGRVPLEASGGVGLDTVRAIAEAGVDIISVGRLTHSAPAAELSMDIVRA
jgi:nicotinate-nucleotide pyrophosphorylase (carboxylating)